MKLATYRHDGKGSYGAVTEDGIVDLPAVWADGPATLLALFQAGPDALADGAARAAGAEATLSPDDVELLAPIPAPPKILALAGNYVPHIKESRLDKGLSEMPHRDTVPRPFIMPSTAVADPGAVIPWPCYSREVDYEIELGVVIGRPAKCVSPTDAADVIAGYTIVNDVSARSVTFSEGRAERPWDEFYDWLNGKWSDGFCPMGPCIVTADQFGDPREAKLRLTVNGEVRQDAVSRDMIFDVYEIVSFLSHLMTLTPGDVIATGTPSGVAMATGNFLAPGDTISCRIEGIGELTNTLGDRVEEFYTPCARRSESIG